MKKASVNFFLIIILAALFHKSLENFLDHTIVKFLLRDIPSSLFTEGVIVAGIGLLFCYYYLLAAKIKSTTSRLLLVLLLEIVYLVYRFAYHHWQLTSFQCLPLLKYSDIILIFGLLELALWIKTRPQPPALRANGESVFFGSRPITGAIEDQLGYVSYAEEIATRLNNSHFDDAFAIGINGKWGSGKSSFLNLVQEKLDQQNRIFIDFKPWNAHDPQAIIKDFFQSVQGAIAPHYATLANHVRDYGKKLLELHDNAIPKNLLTGFNLLTNHNDSLSVQYEEINESLKKTGLQLVIIIDDLDRLDKGEITEVIRIIRNTANFYNTIYLVAYDREYLLTAIKEQNSYQYQHFLEKIFQLEVNLPGFNAGILKTYLENGLIKVFGEAHALECKSAVEDLYSYKVSTLTEWIFSIRDIHHILNSMIVNAVQIKEEILFTDMLKLELLRYRHPKVYTDLFYRREHWLDSEKERFNQRDPIYSLKTGFKNERFIDKDLIDPEGPYQLSKEEANKVVNLLQLLFKQTYISINQDYLAVKYPLNFSKYFYYSLKKNQLSNKEFHDAWQGDIQVFYDKINEWLADDHAIQLNRLFERLEEPLTPHLYENMIRGIIHMSNTHLPANRYSPFRYIAFNLDTFADKIHDYKFRISKKIYNDPEGREGKFKAFVLQLFDQAQYPYQYEAAVLNKLKHGQILDKPVLNREEIQAYLLRYFEDYLSKREHFSFDDWHFLDYFKDGTEVEYEGEQLMTEGWNPAALNLFKAHIGRHLDDFIRLMIRRDIHNTQKQKVGDYALQIFITWANFEAFLEEHRSGSAYLPEFLNFMEQFHQAGKQFINFDFQVIPQKKDDE